MTSRNDLTQRVIDLAKLDLDFDTAVSLWWHDSRPSGGLRLTDQGRDIFLNCLDLDAWHFDIDAGVLIPRNLLVMDRNLACPYHLSRHRHTYTLTLFGSQEAVVANLYGDIELFLRNL